MQIRYVTSMSRKIFDEYGKDMLMGLVALWPEGEILCYSEDRLPEVPRVTYKNLMEIPGFSHFHSVMNGLPIFRGEIFPGQRNYTHDARTFSKKAFAFIDAAVEFGGWLVWVDADVHTKKFIPRSWLEDWILGSFMVVMKRKTWHLCSSFYAMDCAHSFAPKFLQHWYDVWTSGKFLLLKEWHDCAVLEAALTDMPGVKDLGKDITGEGPYNVFDTVFKGHAIHLKGMLKTTKAPQRYEQLNELFRNLKPNRFLEVGTWNGGRAVNLHKEHPFEYVGLDLFEEATQETDKEEKNVKAHHSLNDVSKRLESAGIKHKLYKGNTKDTMAQALKDYGPQSMDFIYIDGGHAVDTIRSDWNYAKQLIKPGGVVVFDDYYTGMDEAELSKFGAQEVLKGMEHVLFPIKDMVAGGGWVQMAGVRC